MPTGKVKWYDAEKGFGFISDDEGSDVFLHANALPEGVATLKGGTRVEFGVAEGRRGTQALRSRCSSRRRRVTRRQARGSRARRPRTSSPLVEDSHQAARQRLQLAAPRPTSREGRTPTKLAAVLRFLADQIEP